MSEIHITRHENGNCDIKSEFPGPHSTIKVLEDVIGLIRKAALEQELKQPQVAVPDGTLQERLLRRGAVGLPSGNGGG